jgi:hypothetical protein
MYILCRNINYGSNNTDIGKSFVQVNSSENVIPLNQAETFDIILSI